MILSMKEILHDLDNNRLSIVLDIDKPIELADLTIALKSLGDDYTMFIKKYLKKHKRKIPKKNIKLYVTKIESGSIIAEFAGGMSFFSGMISDDDYQKIFISYIENFKNACNYCKDVAISGQASGGFLYPQKTIEAIYYFSKITATHLGAFYLRSFNIGIRNGLPIAEFGFERKEAKTIKNGADMILHKQNIMEAQHKKVSMYFHRTNKNKAISGKDDSDNKVIIQSLSPKPLKVHFASDLDADKINSIKTNPKQNIFLKSFIVDVSVETNREKKPLFYRVMAIHEIIDEY